MKVIQRKMMNDCYIDLKVFECNLNIQYLEEGGIERGGKRRL